jgi:hypothetical protein
LNTLARSEIHRFIQHQPVDPARKDQLMQQPQTDPQFAVPAAAESVPPSTEKQPYQQPELRCYGSVTEITLGSGGVRLDGRVNTRKS